MFGDMMGMMGKLKETQAKVKATKERLNTVIIDESSSDGLLKVAITANNTLKEITIDDSLEWIRYLSNIGIFTICYKNGKLIALNSKNNSMKKFILLLFLPILISAQESETMEQTVVTETAVEGEGWLKNYDEALAEAKKEKRNVLVYFTGSDWCPPCKMLKKDLFDTEDFKTVATNYTLLYIDIPRRRDILSVEQMKHNTDLMAKINSGGVFPLMIILDAKGTQLDKYSGYSMNGEVQYHLQLLEKYKG